DASYSPPLAPEGGGNNRTTCGPARATTGLGADATRMCRGDTSALRHVRTAANAPRRGSPRRVAAGETQESYRFEMSPLVTAPETPNPSDGMNTRKKSLPLPAGPLSHTVIV